MAEFIALLTPLLDRNGAAVPGAKTSTHWLEAASLTAALDAFSASQRAVLLGTRTT